MDLQSDNEAPRTRPARPIIGWPLEPLLQLSISCPDLMRVTHYASGLRRQGIFLALAVVDRDGFQPVAVRLGCGDEAAFARALTTKRVRDIVNSLIQPCPVGLFGVLGRLGDHPLPQSLYFNLVDILATGGPRAKSILQVEGRIHAETLIILQLLDEVALRPAILPMLGSVKDAEALNTVIALLRQCTDIDDEELGSSLAQAGPVLIIDEWAEKLLRARLVKLPFRLPFASGNSGLRWIESGKELCDAARNFRNCIASRVACLATGRVAYVVNPNYTMVAELWRLATGPCSDDTFWLATEIVGPCNRTPHKDELDRFISDLHGAGVLTVARPTAPTKAALRALGVYGRPLDLQMFGPEAA